MYVAIQCASEILPNYPKIHMSFSPWMDKIGKEEFN